MFGALAKSVQKSGGIKKQEPPLRIRLAYPVKKQKEAFLTFFELESNPKDILDLNQQITKEPKIIRHLIIKVLPETKREKEEKKVTLKPEIREDEEEPKAEATKEPPAAKKADLAQIDQELEKVLGFDE